MRRLAVLFSSLILICYILSSMYFPVSAESGSRSEDLIIYSYADVESAYTHLKAGDIDMMGYPLTRFIDSNNPFS